MFARALAAEDIAIYDQMDTAVNQLGQLMANRLGIGWTGNSHTSDYVPIAAFGPGSRNVSRASWRTPMSSAITRNWQASGSRIPPCRSSQTADSKPPKWSASRAMHAVDSRLA